MSRPDVDIVVPFAGSAAALDAVVARLARLDLRPGDSVTIADNRSNARPTRAGRVEILAAPGQPSSYFARNRGAEAGRAGWIVFLDADVAPPPDLVERYFDPLPDERAGILAGGVCDEEPRPPGGGGLALRYAWLKGLMAQDTLAGRDHQGFVRTANCAVRRDAFAALGGFREGIRSGGDADLSFRAVAAGWRIDRRPDAVAVHLNRRTLRGLFRQHVRYGASAGWLDREHPGAMPRRRPLGLAWWSARRASRGVAALARGRRDEALVALLDAILVWVVEAGRLLPNHVRHEPNR